MLLPQRQFFFASIVFLLLVGGCASVKKIAIERDVILAINNSEVFDNELLGLCIYDPYLEKYIVNFNADKYFTPASNTKLLTLFASLATLGDSIPTFAYDQIGDSLIIQPLGDPTFLHPDFQEQPALRKLRLFDQREIFLQIPATDLKKYGPGWAWDDYDRSFQPERSVLPLYGNALTIEQLPQSKPTVTPPFFEEYIDFQKGKPLHSRALEQNVFKVQIAENSHDTLTNVVPYKINRELEVALLEDTLKRTITPIYSKRTLRDTLYNGPVMPLLALMMQRSDNFLAEQLLYMIAIQNQNSSLPAAIWKLQKNELSFLPDSLIWVDGSGLSRYNMVTPRSFTTLIHRMYRTMSLGRSGATTTHRWCQRNHSKLVCGRTSLHLCQNGHLKT